jgi:hypothetical protein
MLVPDYFIKLTVAEARPDIGDREGFASIIGNLSKGDADYARHQANELLESRSGKKFGYNPDSSVADNASALRAISGWYFTFK